MMESKDIHSNIRELNKTLKYDPVTLLGIRVVPAFVNGNHIYRIYHNGEHKADLLTLTETKVTIEVLKNENRSL
jgi:hypothetical protein